MSRFSQKMTSALDEIRDILDHDGLTPDSAAILSEKSREVFATIPILPMFVLASVFRDISLLWDDGQAVPTQQVTPFQERLLPELREWIKSNDTFDSRLNMDKVIHMLGDCQMEL